MGQTSPSATLTDLATASLVAENKGQTGEPSIGSQWTVVPIATMGCGQKLRLVYVVNPRLSRYSNGLREPRAKEILIRCFVVPY